MTAIRGNQHMVMMRAIVAFADPDGHPWDHLWTSDATGQIKAWKVPPAIGISPAAGTIGRNRALGSGSGASSSSSPTLLRSIMLPNGDAVCSMCHAQDGGVIVGCDGTLLKMHPQSLRELHRRPKAHRGRITAVTTAGENLLVTAAEDYTVAIWNLSLLVQHRVTYHTGKIHSLSVFRSVFLFSGGFDLRLCVYDLRARKVMGNVLWADKALSTIESVATDSICALCAVEKGPDAGVLWMASRDGILRVFELEMQASSLALVSPRSTGIGWVRTQPGRDSPSNASLLSRLSKARGSSGQ